MLQERSKVVVICELETSDIYFSHELEHDMCYIKDLFEISKQTLLISRNSFVRKSQIFRKLVFQPYYKYQAISQQCDIGGNF